MKKLTLTKKSLDELAKTMDVIPEEERDCYWGMYENDCFWRCVSYLCGAGISEDAAGSFANAYFASQFSGSDAEKMAQAISYLAQNGGDSSIDGKAMSGYLQANNMMAGNSANNRMVGMRHTNNFEYYKNSNIQPYANHCLIIQSVNSDGSYNMFDPQNNVTFSITSQSEKDALVPLNY
ncbi:MAG: hypothetical protein LBQ60_07485 [Bacteroidales bacterium]|jgi:hypothetical protein|nr:hypothetical protein [Bacteroidales bacterium]